MARAMTKEQQALHNQALSATKRLQVQIGASSDGFWGGGSQAAFSDQKGLFSFDWNKLKNHFGPFEQQQVDGFNTIIDAINAYDSDEITPAYVAYMLATTWHETGVFIKRLVNGKKRTFMVHTMQPVEEMGRGRGRKYGGRVDIDGSHYSNSLPIYFGRGYVQLTWLINYLRMKLKLGIDFINHPELALMPKNAANIMIVGMLEGVFTGKSLKSFIHYGLYFEFIAARRIINGTDKDDMIAEYAVKFLDCLVITSPKTTIKKDKELSCNNLPQ